MSNSKLASTATTTPNAEACSAMNLIINGTDYADVFVFHNDDQHVVIRNFDPGVDHMIFDHVETNDKWVSSQHALAMLTATHQMTLDTHPVVGTPADADLWATVMTFDYDRTLTVEHHGHDLNLLHDFTYL